MEEELAKLGSWEPYTLANGEQGKIIADIELTTHPTYNNSISAWVEAIFSKQVLLEGGDYGPKIEIGYCIAHLINARPTADTFKSDLLDADLGYTETRKVMQTLYTAGGARRRQFRDFADMLAVDRILHLDTFIMLAHSRGTGLGRMALDFFHRLMRKLPDPYAFAGTVVLSPGKVEDQDYGGQSDQEIENGLIDFYSKSGYVVLVRGDRNSKVNMSLSVMGRTI
ncbi:hypothetical protein Tdes44962_MAKER01473 [Teratosphaeria destructans]|uniref:Uncharacterized protein n=1 Tax=Teratosphaeria destructans TaxID=418781 RepID=A0A9W7SZ32_9PEZI|nr:hypothetical protein Tdes44962_MAKER01473 [Teratosphaeria destructans]